MTSSQVEYRATRAFFSQVIPSLTVDDISRVIVSANRTLLVSASVSGGNFERLSPDLTSNLLNSCSQVLYESMDSPAETLRAVFSHADRWLREPAGDACGWMTVVLIEAELAWIAWAGGDEVWLVEGESLVQRTRSHSLREQLQLPTVPDTLTRGIGAGYDWQVMEITNEPWRLTDSSQLLLLSRSITRRLSEAEILDSLGNGKPNPLDSIVRSPVLHSEMYALAMMLA